MESLTKQKLEVFESGNADSCLTAPVEREMTIRDLLTHTAGLTYDHIHAHPIDAIYRNRGFFGENMTLSDLVGHLCQLCQLPLLFSPGTQMTRSYDTSLPSLH